MQKLSPFMKGLVETRARAAGDYQTALATIEHRTQYAHSIQIAFDAKLAQAKRAIAHAQAQATAALNARNACDQLITKLNTNIQPAQIEPIHAWKGRYGPRNALGQTIQEILNSAYPSSVSTTTLSHAVQSKFGLTFETPAERKEWVRISILNRLGYLCKCGLVERLHPTHGNTLGQWRSIPTNAVPLDIRVLAAQAGIPLSYFIEDAPNMPANTEEDDLPR